MKKKISVLSAISIVAVILLWQAAATILNASVIVPKPLEVFVALTDLFSTKSFYLNVGFTVLRAFESFVIIVITGAVFGIIAGLKPNFEQVFKPLVTMFKATPVMSVILIAFLWLKTGQVPVFSAFLMGFPVMYVQTLEGMKQRSGELEQMCFVYRIEGRKKLVNVTIPEMIPYLITGAKQSLSMIWKVVVAAEVLTIPQFGVGRSLHMAQIQIETAHVFAWTVIAILLTWIFDCVFNIILKKATRRAE